MEAALAASDNLKLRWRKAELNVAAKAHPDFTMPTLVHLLSPVRGNIQWIPYFLN